MLSYSFLFFYYEIEKRKDDIYTDLVGLYKNRFTIINTFVEIAIQYPPWEVMILH